MQLRNRERLPVRRSDACAVAKRPLVSGAAIGMDGQLTVYCHGEDGEAQALAWV